MKKHFHHIDEIRFLMIHLIVLNHFSMSFFLLADKVDQSLLHFSFEITSPVLAILSGYLFFYGSAEHADFGQKIKRRIPTLLVPYLIWSVAFYFICFGIKIFAANVLHMHFWYHEVQTITPAGIVDSILHPLPANFWYLQNLLLIIPCNFIFLFILKSKPASVVFFSAILIIFAYHLAPLYFEPRFLPFYLIGSYSGYHKIQVPKLHFPPRLIRFRNRALVSVCWVPLTVLLGFETGFWKYDGLLLMALKIIIVLLVVISTWNLLDAYPDSLISRYLKKYKSTSFFIFATHTFIYGAIQRPLFQLAGGYMENKYFTLGFSLLTATIVLLISLAVALTIKRSFPRFFGVITGR